MVTVNKKYLHPDSPDPAAWLAFFRQHPNATSLHIEMIERAIQFVQAEDGGLFLQGFEAADILLEMQLDAETIAAAIVTGTARRLQTAPEILTAALGESVAHLIKNILQMDTLEKLEVSGHLQLDRLRKTFWPWPPIFAPFWSA